MSKALCSCGAWLGTGPENPVEYGIFHQMAGHYIVSECERKIGPYQCCSVVQGDCLELMRLLPDGCVDAVITDPVWPNALAELKGSERPYELFAEACAVLPKVKRIAVIIGCNSDPSFLAPVPLPFFRTCWLEYVRPHYLGRLMYGSDVAYLYGEAPAVRDDQFVVSGRFTAVDAEGKTGFHPCPRKLSHMEWLVRKWTNPGETVLDPFAGSGTTLVAAAKARRHFLGFEIEDRHVATTKNRLARVEAQPSLFQPKPEQLTLGE